MSKKIKISGIIFLLFVSALILWMSFAIEENNVNKIKSVKIKGNYYLTQNDYLNFAFLNNKNRLKNLTLNIICDRLLKHPYIKTVDAKYSGNGVVEVELKEKKFEAFIINKDQMFLLTDNICLIPNISNLKYSDLPIITNISAGKELKRFAILKNNVQIKKSLRIIMAMKLLSREFYSDLSEIDFSNGQNILLRFSSKDYPVVIGENDEVTRVVYLYKLWNSLKDKKHNDFIDYIDLRYSKKIYIGITEGIES